MKNFDLENLTELNNDQLVETFGGDKAAGVAFGCAAVLVGLTATVCGGGVVGVPLMYAGAGVLADAIF